MAYNLFITQNAANELDEITDYIANYLNNPTAAAQFLDEVEKCYKRLSDNPKIYQLCDYLDFKDKGYRKVVIKNYILIFRVDETTQNVYILHFFFGRQDYFSLI